MLIAATLAFTALPQGSQNVPFKQHLVHKGNSPMGQTDVNRQKGTTCSSKCDLWSSLNLLNSIPEWIGQKKSPNFLPTKVKGTQKCGSPADLRTAWAVSGEAFQLACWCCVWDWLMGNKPCCPCCCTCRRLEIHESGIGPRGKEVRKGGKRKKKKRKKKQQTKQSVRQSSQIKSFVRSNKSSQVNQANRFVLGIATSVIPNAHPNDDFCIRWGWYDRGNAPLISLNLANKPGG